MPPSVLDLVVESDRLCSELEELCGRVEALIVHDVPAAERGDMLRKLEGFKSIARSELHGICNLAESTVSDSSRARRVVS